MGVWTLETVSQLNPILLRTEVQKQHYPDQPGHPGHGRQPTAYQTAYESYDN